MLPIGNLQGGAGVAWKTDKSCLTKLCCLRHFPHKCNILYWIYFSLIQIYNSDIMICNFMIKIIIWSAALQCILKWNIITSVI